jgi:hypothetical protein
MKFKHTLLLLLLALGLGAYLWFFDRKLPSTHETARAGNLLVELDRDEITALLIKNPESKIDLRKDKDDRWQLVEPVQDRADAGPAGVVTQLLTTLDSLRYESVIDEKSEGVEKDFAKKAGVADATTKIRITREGKPAGEIHVGADTPAGRKAYARLEGDRKIYVLPNDLKTQISRKADEFRDPRASALTPQNITKVELKTGAGEIELQKSKAGHWSLVRPLKARADDAEVNDLISRVTAARVDQFAPDASNLAAFGLDEPRATVTLTAEGASAPEVFRIGGNPTDPKDPREKEKTWVQLSTRPSVMLVPRNVEQLLATQPNGLRDKHLVRIASEASTDIIDRITIEPAGREKIVIMRKADGTWVRKTADKEVAVNAAIPSRLLADFQSQKVTRFIEGAADLKEFGLDQPQLRITFSSYASENTAESAAGDQPIASVHFGKVEGDHGYAKLDDEPFVVAIPKTLLEGIPTDPTELQSLDIYEFRPDEIAALEVTPQGRPALSIDRDKDGRWKLAKGDGKVDQNNAASLAGTLARLRAVRWVGQPKPEHGLDKPSLVIRFTAAQGDRKTTGALTVGTATQEEFWPATADGLPGVFLISKPDQSALAASLLEKSAQPAATQPAPPAASTPAPMPAPDPAGADSPAKRPEAPLPAAPAPAQ